MIFHPRLTFFPIEKYNNTLAIARLQNYFANDFTDYFAVLKDVKSLNFMIDNDWYFEIWSPQRCIETYENYLFEKYLTQAIPIGGDGGDSVLVYFPTPQNELELYLVELGDLDKESLVFIADNLIKKLYS